ncbi:caspase-7-like isoform X5 [Xenia sp. Carnegie-2017]|uniref:caspase-7-like isoform X5 n=1 Tax=Xenia sp. Carnegie-2017 TaxID=2897299 RepID=UPI001F036B31|nr:caspase-7-like isoform X5 [Xenia sp. Carnegie-2017]
MANNSNMQFLFKKYEVKNAYVFAIINEKFEDPRFKTRKGALDDFQNVRTLMEEFGFELNIKENLTKKKMLEVFKRMKEPTFNNNDAFICFISSHGEGEYFKDSRENNRQRDGVYGTDGEIVYLNGLVDILAHNKSLKGKPIIIIAQHCRGKEITQQNEVKKNSSGKAIKQSIRTTPISIPSHRNVLIAYSTVFNAESYRDPEKGSLFIYYFMEVLRHNDENMSLIDILSKVHNHVARCSFGNGLKQMPCFSNSLTMSVFFKKSIKGTKVSLPIVVPTSETQKSDEAPNPDATEKEENEHVPKTEFGDDEHASKIQVEDNKDVSKTEMEGNKDVSKTERLIEKAFVFIIINEVFDTKKREGAQVDLRNILQVCETFGFEKHVEENLSRDEMEEKILKKIEKGDFSVYDALIVFISSYGEHNDVIGVCGQKISIDDFVKSMAKNPTLNNSGENKPKLIFSENSSYSVVETDHGRAVPLPMHADVLVAHSNLLRGKTYHDSVFGSWFMHWLTTFLKDFGDKMSLTHILTMVNDFVANVGVRGTKDQVPCFSSSLRMALRFQRVV